MAVRTRAVQSHRRQPNLSGILQSSGGTLFCGRTPAVSHSITATPPPLETKIDNAGVDYGSLADGRWQLSILPANYTSPNSPNDVDLRRFFGNVDNDTQVGATDFGFYPPFGAAVGSPFDYDNTALGNRYGITLV